MSIYTFWGKYSYEQYFSGLIIISIMLSKKKIFLDEPLSIEFLRTTIDFLATCTFYSGPTDEILARLFITCFSFKRISLDRQVYEVLLTTGV